jgi:predicted deacylase
MEPRSFDRKWIVAILLGVLVALGIAYAVLKGSPPSDVEVPKDDMTPQQSQIEVIGKSVEGRDIEAYTFGTGERKLLFVGGIHGGYEWNSVILAYQFIDHLNANPASIPADVTVAIVPNANPDGVFKVIDKEGRIELADITITKEESAPGRFNAHGVDLNRNFDCKWKPESTWRSQVVSAGTAAFSEPEAAALRDFIQKDVPVAAIFWHSQSNAVYASECENGILPETRTIMNAYSQASGYPPVDSFDAYPISGDAEGWLASIGIPAITVELQTHETVEWERNLAGFKALVAHFAPPVLQ